MKVATSNRLAHYQVEYQELSNQTAMLNAQLPSLQQQIAGVEQYLSVNVGDRNARANYNALCQRYRNTCTAIRRNTTKLQSLMRQIAYENQRLANGSVRRSSAWKYY